MEAAEARVGNIGERGCRRRRIGGWVWAVVAAVMLGWLIMSHSPRAMLLTLAVPIALAAVGFLQAREQTCVVHAMLGTRETDHGVARIDPGDASQVRTRARRVMWEAIAWAVGIVVVIYVVVGRL